MNISNFSTAELLREDNIQDLYLLKFVIRKTKNLYYMSKINSVKNNPRKLWQQINCYR